jgi:hypothetical protein
MMGGAGSGRGLGKEEREAVRAAAKTKRTQETGEFLSAEATQRGDRLFKVVRVYANGHKATVGTIFSVKESIIGAQFGGGVYELHELDRATEFETGKIIKRTLHPSAYPPKKQFSMDPHQLDFEENESARAGAGPSAAAGGLTGLSREELFAKAKAEAIAEFRREETQKQLERRLAELDAKLERMANGGMAGGTGSKLEEITAIFDMFKKLMPTPQPNFGAPQLTPQQQLQESVEFLKSMRESVKVLQVETAAEGKITPMAEKMLSSLADLAGRGFSVWERSQAANGPRAAGGAGRVIEQEQVAPAGSEVDRQGWARTRNPAPAPPPQMAPPNPEQREAGWALTRTPKATLQAAQAPGPGTWPKANPHYNATRADFGTEEEWQSFQEDTMTFELIEFVKKEMDGLLAGTAGYSIFLTAEEIRKRWTAGTPSAAWLKLRDGIRTYDTLTLVNHFVGLQPDLCPTQAHRDCLASLIDVIKEREGVKA